MKKNTILQVAAVVMAAAVVPAGEAYALTETANMSVTAHIVGDCAVVVGNIAFGTVDLTAAKDEFTEVLVKCQTAAPLSGAYVTVGPGRYNTLGPDATLRAMRNQNGSYLSYGLYSDENFTLHIDPTAQTFIDANDFHPHGPVIEGAVPVFARVPIQAQSDPGDYSDTVVVTLDYEPNP